MTTVTGESEAVVNAKMPPRLVRAPKVGVFVVAYNAEKTIASVLSRIPTDTWERIDEVFIFDDSSRDDTVGRVREFKRQAPDELAAQADKIKVFYNQVNLGYGGNQKRGYAYADAHGFDIVVLLHGDGQYAPEQLDRLIDPIADGEAQAVFGSRMLDKGAARRGGMPLYKYVGNKVLTGFQNKVLGESLSEYHSGYRAYHVPSVAALPLHACSNDFDFDNEIIVQLIEAGHTIKEVPIPTYYGDEICHVDGVAYGWKCIRNTIAYRLHKAGLAYDKRYDLKAGEKYQLKHNRHSSHQQILRMIRRIAERRDDDEHRRGRFSDHAHASGSDPDPKQLPLRALDVGCGSGYLAAAMADMGMHVIGVDVYDNAEARVACHDFHQADIDQTFGISPEARFDVIVFADVLEHLREPERVLLRARRHLAPGGKIIATTGNVAHAYVRFGLLLGRFRYTERGILDRTHTRLFTRHTFRQLFRDTAFGIVRESGSPVPFENVIPGRRTLANLLCGFNQLFVRLWPGMFAYQLLVIAEAEGAAPSDLLRQQQIEAAYDPAG